MAADDRLASLERRTPDRETYADAIIEALAVAEEWNPADDRGHFVPNEIPVYETALDALNAYGEDRHFAAPACAANSMARSRGARRLEGRVMVAVLDVNMTAGRWAAEFVHTDDLEWEDRPPSKAKWERWLAPAIEWQAMRGGGIFVAIAPI